jgi:hypothetical protein
MKTAMAVLQFIKTQTTYNQLPRREDSVRDSHPNRKHRAVHCDTEPRIVEQRVVFCIEHCRFLLLHL